MITSRDQVIAMNDRAPLRLCHDLFSQQWILIEPSGFPTPMVDCLVDPSVAESLIADGTVYSLGFQRGKYENGIYHFSKNSNQ